MMENDHHKETINREQQSKQQASTITNEAAITNVNDNRNNNNNDNNNDANVSSVQMQQSNNDEDLNTNIDIGIDATTLPLYDSKKQLINCSQELFSNLRNYITSEIELTLEDYKLLEAMNSCTMEKFQDLTQIATKIHGENEILNQNYQKLLPKLDIIDKLDSKVTRLEKMAYAIDAYSKRLEKQYKLLEKGLNNHQQQQQQQQQQLQSNQQSNQPNQQSNQSNQSQQ